VVEYIRKKKAGGIILLKGGRINESHERRLLGPDEGDWRSRSCGNRRREQRSPLLGGSDNTG